MSQAIYATISDSNIVAAYQNQNLAALQHCLTNSVGQEAIRHTEGDTLLYELYKIVWLEGCKCLFRSGINLSSEIHGYWYYPLCSFADIELLKMVPTRFGSKWNWSKAMWVLLLLRWAQRLVVR